MHPSSTSPPTIAVLGTPGTVRSGAYPAVLNDKGHTGLVTAVACPLLVPLAEEGWTAGEVPALVVDRYLQTLPPDTGVVILGCTHYPLLKGVIAERLARLRPGAIVVDGAAATAAATAATLAERGLSAPPSTAPRHRLLVTDAPQQMAALAPAFLGEEVQAKDIELVDVVFTA